jgi:exodeoxyribonuclease V alpha subunit
VLRWSRATVAAEAEALAGLVERVTFHNTERGFCVLQVKGRGSATWSP